MATAYQIANTNWRMVHGIPHLYSGNLYVRLYHRFNDEIAVWKSGDGGATWSQISTAKPAGNGFTFIPGSGTVSGSVMYITYHYAGSTPDSLRVARWDMSTDAWLSDWVGPDVPFSQWNQCGVRSDGSLVIIYLHTEPLGLGFQRKWKCVTCDSSGTFGTPADLSTAWQTWTPVSFDVQLGPVPIAADDAAHFFYYRSLSGSSSADLELMHRRLTSAGVLSSEATAVDFDGTVFNPRGGLTADLGGTDSVLYGLTDGNGIVNAPAVMHGAASGMPASYTVHGSEAVTLQWMAKVGSTVYATWPVSESSGQFTGVEIATFNGSFGSSTTVNDGTGGEPTWNWWTANGLGTDAIGFVLEHWSNESPWFIRHPLAAGLSITVDSIASTLLFGTPAVSLATLVANRWYAV